MTQKIRGYRDLSEVEIALMNEGKELAEQVGAFLDKLGAHPKIDQRWRAIATTQLQQGFMAAARAVAQPTTF